MGRAGSALTVPSYRVRAAVVRLRPGVAAVDVLPAAVAAARGRTTVEAQDVDVAGGQAHVAVRFTAADDEHAREVTRVVLLALAGCAVVTAPTLTQRTGARWRAVAPGREEHGRGAQRERRSRR